MPGCGDVNWPHIIGLLKTAPRLRSFQSEVIPARVHAPIKKLVSVFNDILNG
jgi:hypothetical protein